MEKLIDVVNKLQDTFSGLGKACPFDLPQIAVVGAQSAGKSSVLENFVGRDFLPRGKGIVTRRPLVLQLINQNGPEYGVFSHNSKKKYTDFLQIRREIQDETDRSTGTNKGISSIPIVLRIYSPNVDLPGITKVPVGDQPPDIETQIRDMILHYIKQENCLILAVTQATDDLANSEALKLARSVDPGGLRTIGVITKIDLMDKGTDCMEILENKVYHLKRGYVGVVNRNQMDIEKNKDIKSAQESELQFFKDHPKYKKIADHMGTPFLQKTLSKQLADHISLALPGLRQSIMDELIKIRGLIDKDKELFAKVDDGDKSNPMIVMIKIQQLSREVDANFGYQNEFVNMEELSPASKIGRIMFQRFFLEMAKIKFKAVEVKKNIRIAILNSQGLRHNIFGASGPFMAVVRQYLRETEAPCLFIVEMVNQEIRRVINDLISRIFSYYPDLGKEITAFSDQKIDECNRKARKYTKFFVNAQVEYVNTSHPDFLSVQNPSRDKSALANRKLIAGIENMMHREDNAIIVIPGALKSNKEYFCSLRGQAFSIYKNSMKTVLKEHVIIMDCKLKDMSKGNRFQICIYRKDNGPMSKTLKSLELICKSSEDCEDWKAAFVSAGVELDQGGDTTDISSVNTDKESELSAFDSELNKQIEYVYCLVDSYFKIISKSLQDIVCKLIVLCLISRVRQILYADLVTHLFVLGIDPLMQESPELVEKRNSILQMQRSCQQALNTINSFIASDPRNLAILKSSEPRHSPALESPYDHNLADYSNKSLLKASSDINLIQSSESTESKSPKPQELSNSSSNITTYEINKQSPSINSFLGSEKKMNGGSAPPIAKKPKRPEKLSNTKFYS